MDYFSSLRASRQVDDECFVPDTSRRSGDHRHRCHAQRLGQHHGHQTCKLGALYLLGIELGLIFTIKTISMSGHI